MFLPQVAVVFSLFATTYAGIGPSVIDPTSNLVIGNKDIQPDGFSRSAVLAGASSSSLQFPGPVIMAKKGDKFNLNVINELKDKSMETTTSVHWHGLFQEGSNWADGPVGVNQCPIAPGDSFLYKFQVLDQAGTFWYHAHDSTQYCDGLRGALVVYDPNDPYKHMYDFDDESTIISLADWYHLPSPQLDRPTADSTLINGLGRDSNTSTSALAVISVSEGKRYRFRLISMSCAPDYVFSIDGHSMLIIEADGINTKPLLVDSIPIFAGQRYSFILTANQPMSNYWIRAGPTRGKKGFAGGINSAILKYTKPSPLDPATPDLPTPDPTTPLVPSTKPMLETNLHPLEKPGAPGIHILGDADVVLNLKIAFNLTTDLFTVNNYSFIPPTPPVLLQILSNAQPAQDLMPPGSVYTLPRNKVIEISIPGGSPGSPHPFHLHGHTFDVIRSAGSSVYNFDNPVRRDVVNTGIAGDNTTIRFKTDNAGAWVLHCHIDFHFNTGLAIVFAEDIPTIKDKYHKPPVAWDQLCDSY